ncbi:4'-phosphopantetheinyl transferase [Desulfitobacterium hafniense DCB-2]|uniref:4'-phosphopantetheinyl transferase n=2 Tax=root TaxID=1 RepID=B8FSW5_DESHD|nr:4'-phosphopantetheinyl transferase superfamily protein [Desulfitobacterium hafniense]ACL21981.1 4'-phosphopantetheinyl transferase [Desulfitobacterium hafniense DCB-2]MEA5022357.1 4'-phosphopantetheinyl transferase superfamily protein [Desulfitobacterium hafniense]
MNTDGERLKLYHITSNEKVAIPEVKDLLNKGIPQIFLVNTNRGECRIESFRYLTREEEGLLGSYRQESDQNNYRVTHSIVNYIYANVLHCGIEELLFGRGKYQKPFISNDLNYHYNIAHSKNFALVGIHGRELGVDIESIDEGLDYKAIARDLFAQEDREYIQREPGNFFRLWVAKEAYLKLRGTGFYSDLKELAVKGEEEGKIILLDKTSGSCHPVFMTEHLSCSIGFSCL